MSPIQDIKKAAAGHGRGCTCYDCLREYNCRGHYGFDAVLAWRLAAAAVLFIAGAVLFRSFPSVSAVLSALSILAAGYDTLIRAAANLIRRRRVDEDLLMSIVAVAAVCIGRWLEGAFYMLLLQAGVMLRGYAMEKTRRNVLSVADISEAEEKDVFSRMFYEEEGRTRLEEFIAHFARFYTPIILGIAVLFAVLGPFIFSVTLREAVYRALMLMVIACPCAIVVSVPLGYIAGIGGAARQGLMFRDSRAVGTMSAVSAVVFDKSAALEGDGMRIVSIKSERLEADVFLRIAAHACALAEGPRADSIKAAYTGTIYIELIQRFHQDGNRGVTVEVDGVSIILGSREYVGEHGVDPGADAEEDNSVYLAIDGQYAGRILFGSVLKTDAAAAVSALDWETGRLIAMVTEEPPSAAEKFARSAGIVQYYADCGPEQKISIVNELKEQKLNRGSLVFVGNAQSDSGCFRAADAGVSMGSATGENLASADLVVTDGSPSGLLAAMDSARRTRNIVLQNIIGVLAFKAIVLVLDMAGICPLWVAELADVGAALAAVINCFRALIAKETSKI